MNLSVKLILPVMFCVFLAENGSGDEPYKEWFRFLKGEWGYKISPPFNETGTATWRLAAKGNAMVLRTAADTGVVGLELCGWQADKERLLANGYGSDQSNWTIEFTSITEDEIKGENYGTAPDGNSFKGQFVGKKVDADHYEWTFTGKDGEGKPLTVTGKYERKK